MKYPKSSSLRNGLRPLRAVSLMLALGGLAALSGQASVQQVVVQGSTPGTIYQPTGSGLSYTSYASFPQAMSLDAMNGTTPYKKVFVVWKFRHDNDPDPQYLNYKVSTDGGKTFGAAQTTTVNLRSGLRKRDGTLIACEYLTAPVGASPATNWTFKYLTSSDNGSTWTSHTGTTSFGTYTVSGYRNHTGMLEDNNGNLFMPCYGKNEPNPTVQDFLLKSTDGGASWKYFSTPAYDGTRDQVEMCMVRCADNSWLAMTRNATGSTTHILRWMRSTDEGLNWTSEADVTGLTAGSGHVDPELTLLPNGVLVLTYGKINAGGDRDVRMAFSADGNGTTWTNDTLIFQSVDGGANGDESTGYTGNVPVSAHRLLNVGDTGTGWNYGIGYGGTIPSPNPFRTWGKFINVVTGNRTQIDLKTLHGISSVIHTATDLTYTDAAHPETGSKAAFDGSTNYWSGAFKTGTSGTYQLDLQQTYSLIGVGVCLHYNNPESATIQLSTDGSTWSTVKTYTNAVHNTIDYTNFSATPARYVRVLVSGSGARVCLNEIQLLDKRDTFEGFALESVPYAYTAPNGMFVVTDTVSGVTAPIGYQSSCALYMNDNTSANAYITRTVATAQTTKNFTFRIKPLAYASGGCAQFHILSGSTSVYWMAVFSDGSLHYYNGTTWNQIGTGGAGTVPLNTWSLIDVSATTTSATVSVNGVSKGSAGKATTFTTMNGYKFGSSGSAGTGDRTLFDDVWMSY